MLPPMPGVTTTEVDETSAPHPDAPFGAGPRKRKRFGGGGSDRPRSLVRTSVTLVLGLLLTVVFSWSVIAVLDASSFPAPLHHLHHRLFDSPVLVPSVMAVWVFVMLFVALIGRLWLALGVLTAHHRTLRSGQRDQARAAQRPPRTRATTPS